MNAGPTAERVYETLLRRDETTVGGGAPVAAADRDDQPIVT